MADLTAIVTSSLPVCMSSQFPAHCYDTDFLLPVYYYCYYFFVELAPGKSASGPNYCSLAEVAKSPATGGVEFLSPRAHGHQQGRQKLLVR